MENIETLATLGTQDTGKRQTKQNKNTAQHRKLTRWVTRIHHKKTGDEPRW